jgi:hypothetical protein
MAAPWLQFIVHGDTTSGRADADGQEGSSSLDELFDD